MTHRTELLVIGAGPCDVATAARAIERGIATGFAATQDFFGLTKACPAATAP